MNSEPEHSQGEGTAPSGVGEEGSASQKQGPTRNKKKKNRGRAEVATASQENDHEPAGESSDGATSKKMAATVDIQRALELLSLGKGKVRTAKTLEQAAVRWRPMVEKDCSEVHKLLNAYLNKFLLLPLFTLDDFKHWFLPRDGIVASYVVEKAGKITDFVSFYTLPSTVVNHPVHKTLKAAYAFYNVSTATPWIELMQDALISAKAQGFDVFNALDLMDNKEFLEHLKFGIGDGNLQYYLYNWRCPEMGPEQVGLVLQ
ncbi:unnamed protein product [Cyprideis torosa]|uniref:Glycylpeptide N-tetradecanoyltransferase n=1 Tax=Cyprideis torosa TaxID=163714 RepID=A0A7R8W0N6_9CRUS|nr:unnamed protein product [Cyprideis torosa]CAG0879797.1 unnamed protein product [Cyprideis torosa]